jgi:hypothetical protein
MSSGERGALLHDFPQTFSIKNWPFLAAIKVAGVKVSNQYTVTIGFDDGKTHVVWPMEKGAEAAVELAARAGVKVEALDEPSRFRITVAR